MMKSFVLAAALGFALSTSAYAAGCVVAPFTNHGGGQIRVTIHSNGTAHGESEMSATDKTLVKQNGTWTKVGPKTVHIVWEGWEPWDYNCQ